MSKLVKREFLAWKDGTLADRSVVDRHLRECASCRAYYERMAHFLDPASADGLPVLQPDPVTAVVVAASRGAARRENAPGRRSTVQFSLRGAGVAAAILVGIALAVRLLPTPPEDDLEEIVLLYNDAVFQEDFTSQLELILDQPEGLSP